MVTITREQLDRNETLGTLVMEGFTCKTVERPDLNNQAQISCIPKGTYQCVKVGATKEIPYAHISILNVINRSGVCIHIGNFVTDSKGCILVCESFADINKDRILDGVNSKNTFNKLMAILPNKFEITIK